MMLVDEFTYFLILISIVSASMGFLFEIFEVDNMKKLFFNIIFIVCVCLYYFFIISDQSLINLSLIIILFLIHFISTLLIAKKYKLLIFIVICLMISGISYLSFIYIDYNYFISDVKSGSLSIDIGDRCGVISVAHNIELQYLYRNIDDVKYVKLTSYLTQMNYYAELGNNKQWYFEKVPAHKFKITIKNRSNFTIVDDVDLTDLNDGFQEELAFSSSKYNDTEYITVDVYFIDKNNEKINVDDISISLMNGNKIEKLSCINGQIIDFLTLKVNENYSMSFSYNGKQYEKSFNVNNPNIYISL